MQVTDLSKVKNTEVVKISPFIDGTECIVELKKIDLQRLVVSGVLPNPLLQKATTLFKDKKKVKDNKVNTEDLKDIMELLEILAKQSLVKPSYKEFQEHGIELSIQQLTDIMNTVLKGVKELEDFRS